MSWSVQWQTTELLVPLCTASGNKFTVTDLGSLWGLLLLG